MTTNTGIYQDIATRTAGDIYIGVVGPVRAGKSTFIKRFMETQIIPNIDNVYRRERAKDELPQSGSGRTVMTSEPKFVPEEAVDIALDEGASCSVRLIDCVGRPSGHDGGGGGAGHDARDPRAFDHRHRHYDRRQHHGHSARGLPRG